VTKRFLAYGHRLSFGYVCAEMLREPGWNRWAASMAADVAAWNQLGCLSPHVVYVESGGSAGAEEFAGTLAAELRKLEEIEPRGELPTEGAAVITSRRMVYAVRSAHSRETRMWTSENSTAWTVVFETDPRFQSSCLNRFVYVKSVNGIEEALQAADAVRGKVSTVALASPPARSDALATALARWGVTRICVPGRMQTPPLTWRHDGRPALGDLVTWTDFER